MQINKRVLKKAKRLADRAALLRAGRAGAVRYPASLRQEIADCVGALRREHASWDRCYEVLGISKATLVTWHRNHSESTNAGGASHTMIAVKVKGAEGLAPRPSELAIQMPSGLRVTGVSLEDVMELLRSLG